MISAIQRAKQKLADNLTIDPKRAAQARPVTVSIDQLSKLRYVKKEGEKRFSNVYYSPHSDYTDYRKIIKRDPHFPKHHPYDITEMVKGTKEWDLLSPKRDLYEHVYRVETVPFIPYVNTLAMQTHPQRYLEYLRLIRSVWPNPFANYDLIVTPHTQYYTYVDKATGEQTDATILYPVWTLDRFKETVINFALNESFTALDIARINDPKLLETAYDRLLNRMPEVKSWIDYESVVSVIGLGKDKKFTEKIPDDLRAALKIIVDDALTVVRASADKLAASTIEAKTKPRDFIGPAHLNPLSFSPKTSSDIDLPDMSAPPRDAVQPQPQKPVAKKTNLALPLSVGAAVAAAGVFLAR